MRTDGNYGSTIGYEPNSYEEWQEQSEFKEPLLEIDGAADHWNHREDDNDYYSQAGDLFRMMRSEQKQVLFENTARNMGDAPKEIKIRHIKNCMQADKAYGNGIAKELKIELSEI
jgi:catalase